MGFIWNNDLCRAFTETEGRIKACSECVDKIQGKYHRFGIVPNIYEHQGQCLVIL